MSFKAQSPQRPGIFRSRSFSGFLNGRGMNSPTSPIGTPILGQSLRSPQSASKKINQNVHKLPKIPRPSRALPMFDSVRKGIQECIQATREDIQALRISEDISSTSSTGQGRIVELEKQVKAAERYQKKLEFHLAKIEELEDNYNLQLQLRQGVQTMAKAYVSSNGENKKESLLQVKCGYKECTQAMCAIEAQLENMLGTFHCTMKGLDGFARLIPGDVFEVTVKHGVQKWKTKGRVGTNSQRWDNRTHVFKAAVGDVFSVKAQENKSLKSIVLGEKSCETRGLFSSHPQVMTVNINSTGSIKLSILISWSPLEGIDETFQAYEPTPRVSSTPRRRLVQSMYISSDSCSDLSSEHSSSSAGGGSIHQNHRFSVPTFPTFTPIPSPYTANPSPLSPGSPGFYNPQAKCMANQKSQYPNSPYQDTKVTYQSPYQPSGGATRPSSIAIMGTISELDGLDTHADVNTYNVSAVKPKLFDMRLLRNSLEEDTTVIKTAGQTSHHPTLEECLVSLKLSLEDYQGRYSEMQFLEEQVAELQKLLQRNAGQSTPSKEISVSIENALGAFDFLESSEYYHDGYGSGKNSRRCSLDQLESQCTLSPESTAKTADSGIECIASRLSEHGKLDESLSNSPEAIGTGNEEVDASLTWHLAYCERLLHFLGNFGPLKCREIYSLDKLKKQAKILESLVQIAKKGPVVKDLQEVMMSLTKSKELRQFWVKCINTTVLHVNAEKFLAHLERSFGDIVREKYEVSASTVFRNLVAKIIDVPLFNPEMSKPCPNLTMHQLFSYFSQQQEDDILKHVQDLAGELWVVNRLHCGDTDIVIKTVLSFRDCFPPVECLRVMALLLLCDNIEICTTVATYIKSVGLTERNRKQAIVILVEALEEQSADLRCAAVIALTLLQATESLQQLVYMSHTDPSHHVRHKAKEAIMSFGDEGQQAYEESQRTVHGFQGLNMKL